MVSVAVWIDRPAGRDGNPAGEHEAKIRQAAHLLRQLDECPESLRWLASRHAAGDRLDVGKMDLLSLFLAGATLDPALLQLLGPATSHAGLRDRYDRHLAEGEARYDADDEWAPESAEDVEGVPPAAPTAPMT
jgi:hypothetical protein